MDQRKFFIPSSIHVCSLARLTPRSMKPGRAYRHAVAAHRPGHAAEPYCAGKSPGARRRRHHHADRGPDGAGRGAYRAADPLRRRLGPRRAHGGALFCRHQPLDRRRLRRGLRARSAARRMQIAWDIRRASRTAMPNARMGRWPTTCSSATDGMIRAIETIVPATSARKACRSGSNRLIDAT